MPLQATSGAASYDAFGGGADVAPKYIEEVFSTWLYTGNGSTQTITNGIDLAGKGGLVWEKGRSAADNHNWQDTVRGTEKSLFSNLTAAQTTESGTITSFNSDGFSLGSNSAMNVNARTYASWTFREQPKFFDVVTWTGNGANRTIAHNLGSVPGCIIVKRTDTTGRWWVYHKDVPNTSYLVLNTTGAQTVGANVWNNTSPTSTVFTVGTNSELNATGGTYVAYLYAHDAGGFGLTGTDNVITCGSYTGNGSATGPVVTLGYEPQWLMIKNASGTGSWQIMDSTRGMTVGYGSALQANLTNADGYGNYASLTATGFQITRDISDVNTSSSTYIYIAIRRGPMKVPTTGTSVFGLNARNGTGANATVTGGAGVSDAVLIKNRGVQVADLFASRLTKIDYMATSATTAETSAGIETLQESPWDVMDGVKVGTTSQITNASGSTFINYLFSRAPGFFDVVFYTGAGSPTAVAHNLAAAPELMIVKRRNLTGGWVVYSAASGASKYQYLNTTAATATFTGTWNNTAPTNSFFTVGTDSEVNASASTYIAYLFATCPGVSKVGSYTGNGSSQTINCGFTGGARFVLIKRTDSTGDWYVWDTARGIVAGNDPYFLLNSNAAEVTSNDTIDTNSTGFVVNQVAATNVNVNAATYIFLAIA